MGLYNSIMVPCPKCGRREEFQSKSGSTECGEYMLENTPLDVLEDVNRHGPRCCRDCGTCFDVGPGARVREVGLDSES